MRRCASGRSSVFANPQPLPRALIKDRKVLTRCLHRSSPQLEDSTPARSYPPSRLPRDRAPLSRTHLNDGSSRLNPPRSKSDSLAFRSLNLTANTASSGQPSSATGKSGKESFDLRSLAASPPAQYSRAETRTPKPPGKWVARPRSTSIRSPGTGSSRPDGSRPAGSRVPRSKSERSGAKRDRPPNRRRGGSGRNANDDPFAQSDADLAYAKEIEERERPKAIPHPLEIPDEASFSGVLPSVLVGERGIGAVIEDTLARLAHKTDPDARAHDLAESMLRGEYVAVRDDKEKAQMLAVAQKLARERAVPQAADEGETASAAEIEFETLNEDSRQRLVEKYVLGKRAPLEKPFDTPQLRSAVPTAQRTGSYGPEDMAEMVSKLKKLMPAAKDNSKRKAKAL